MQGKVEAGVLPDLFRGVYLERATGMLRFARGDEHASIRFVKGHIVYGEASRLSLRMGEVLVAQGMLSEEHLARATELVLIQKVRLGEALLALSIVDMELLEEFLTFHVRAILIHALGWRDGTYYFEEQDPETRQEYDFPLKMSTGEMLMDAVRNLEDPDVVRFGIGDTGRVLLQSTDPLLRFQRVTLSTIDGFVLSRVDGTATAREVIQVTPLPDEAIESSLLALLCAGILELAPLPAADPAPAKAQTAQFLRQEILDLYASLGDKRPHEILGVADDAGRTQVKAAYLKLAKRYHPDVHHDPALVDLRDKLESIFFKLNDAYQALNDTSRPGEDSRSFRKPEPTPAPTSEAPASMEPGHAQQMLERAQSCFDAGRYWEAIALAGEVVYLGKGRLRQRARVLLGRSHMKYPESVKQAEKELGDVIAEDPDNADAHFYLGRLFVQTQRPNRAVAMFKRVLELKTRHREAAAELEHLEGQSAAARPGFLKKLLGQ